MQLAVGVTVAMVAIMDVVVGIALVATVLGVGVSINVNMWLSAESFCLQSIFTSTSHYNSSPNWCVYAKLTRLILHDVEVNICCKQKDSVCRISEVFPTKKFGGQPHITQNLFAC